MKVKQTMRKKQGGGAQTTLAKSDSKNGFTWASAEHDGYKSPSEDRHSVLPIGKTAIILAVFDGHGGSSCSQFVNSTLPETLKKRIESENAIDDVDTLQAILEEECLAIDEVIKRKRLYSGSTGSIAIITPTHIVVANIGDSPVLYFTSNGELLFHSIDHDCNNVAELKRLNEIGGICGKREDGPMALADKYGIPSLMVTRAFGDLSFKPFAIAKPSLYLIKRQPDTFLVVCSDSFTERYQIDETGRESIHNIATPKEVVDTILPNLINENLTEGVFQAVEAQVKQDKFFNPLLGKFYGDNTTLVAVKFSAKQEGGRRHRLTRKVRKGKARKYT